MIVSFAAKTGVTSVLASVSYRGRLHDGSGKLHSQPKRVLHRRRSWGPKREVGLARNGYEKNGGYEAQSRQYAPHFGRQKGIRDTRSESKFTKKTGQNKANYT
jgi:hypothetical protein